MPATEVKPLTFKTGAAVHITICKTVNRATARRTLERLFCADKALMNPLSARSKNFIPLPKRRGGCIWTKRTNKIHVDLAKGSMATILATPQFVRDLNSVSDFVEVK